jgi:uncharacterized protein YcfL
MRKLRSVFLPIIALIGCSKNIDKYNVMKKLALLLFISIMFVTCEKDYLISNKDVPDWLKADIKLQEQIIKDSPQLMNAYGGWLRYDCQNEYYF